MGLERLALQRAAHSFEGQRPLEPGGRARAAGATDEVEVARELRPRQSRIQTLSGEREVPLRLRVPGELPRGGHGAAEQLALEAVDGHPLRVAVKGDLPDAAGGQRRRDARKHLVHVDAVRHHGHVPTRLGLQGDRAVAVDGAAEQRSLEALDHDRFVGAVGGHLPAAADAEIGGQAGKELARLEAGADAVEGPLDRRLPLQRGTADDRTAEQLRPQRVGDQPRRVALQRDLPGAVLAQARWDGGEDLRQVEVARGELGREGAVVTEADRAGAGDRAPQHLPRQLREAQLLPVGDGGELVLAGRDVRTVQLAVPAQHQSFERARDFDGRLPALDDGVPWSGHWKFCECTVASSVGRAPPTWMSPIADTRVSPCGCVSTSRSKCSRPGRKSSR